MKKSLDGIAYCRAQNYNLGAMVKTLGASWPLEKYEKDVAGFQISDSEAFFIFSYGAIVFWNVPAEKRKQLLEAVRPFEEKELKAPLEEPFTFSVGTGDASRVVYGHFDIATSHIEEKLTISYALSQSVKLWVLENAIETLIRQTKFIPEDLAHSGKISLSRRDISKQMGKLFLEKSMVNLSSSLLDTPEFFWDRGHLKPLYMAVCHEWDVDDRTELLNHRYDMIQEIYTLLSGVLQHQHGMFLEWIIIILITTEIFLALANHFSWFKI